VSVILPDSFGHALAAEAAPVGVRVVDYAAPMTDSGDVMIEVWSPRESAKRAAIGFAPLPWVFVAAAAGLIAAGLILLTRRR
jgi:hypothetical protein